MNHPPSVDAVRRRAVERESRLGELAPGLLSGICRLALRPGSVDEVAEEAVEWGLDLLREPPEARLSTLTVLLASELYGLPSTDLAVAGDPAHELGGFFQNRGTDRVWLCRGQKLTLADGRRLADVLSEMGLEVIPFGTTNRCLARELDRGWCNGDGAVWAASGSFRLTGFVEHLCIAELAQLAKQTGRPAAVLLDDWLDRAPDLVGLPAFIIPSDGAGCAVGAVDVRPPSREASQKLFYLLREQLLGAIDKQNQ